MRKSKEAKFFCESCGSEVKKNDKVCSTCGKFFAAVKCPKCGRTGSTEEFQSGCPTCGYAVNPDSLNSRGSGGNSLFGKYGSNKKGTPFYKNRDLSIFTGSKKTYHSDSSLPIWVYILCIIVLVFLVVMLYSCLYK